MKTTTKICVGAGLVLAVAYFWRPTETSQTVPKETPRVSMTTKTRITVEPKIQTPALRPNPADPPDVTPPNVHSQTHGPAEFRKGQLQNIFVSDDLQMGNDASFAPHQQPFKIFGIYTSPELMAGDLFDTVTPSYDGFKPEGTELTFEFRTQPEVGDWSTWHEVKAELLDMPVKCELATAVQYRLTFYADDPANGPKVHTVTVSTRNSEVAKTAQSEMPATTLQHASNQRTQNPQDP